LNLPAPLSSIKQAKQNVELLRRSLLGTAKLWAIVLSDEQHTTTSEDAHRTPPSYWVAWVEERFTEAAESEPLSLKREATHFQLRSL
jgi:hypothetical protein